MAVPLPRPVVFDLSARDQAILANAYRSQESGRGSSLLLFSALSQTIGPTLRLYDHRGNDPRSLVILVIALTLVVLVTTLILRSRCARLFATSQVATIITFETSGLSVERTRRGARTTRMLPFDQIRSVRLLPQAVVISSHRQPLLILPTQALPDAAAELMSFFDDRLTGKRMLVRSSSGRKTIVEGPSTARVRG